jgi:hypothetical protein
MSRAAGFLIIAICLAMTLSFAAADSAVTRKRWSAPFEQPEFDRCFSMMFDASMEAAVRAFARGELGAPLGNNSTVFDAALSECSRCRSDCFCSIFGVHFGMLCPPFVPVTSGEDFLAFACPKTA